MEKYLYTPYVSQNDHNLVMAYPERESFALSSLGYMSLFKNADMTEYVNASRVSLDKPNFTSKKIDSVAFSMSFDFDFINVFKILEKNDIPIRSSERNETHPLIFAGGPVITTNPAPYTNIFDFMIIGDGETVFVEVLKILSKNLLKEKTLEQLSSLEGIYVPNISKSVKKVSAKLENVIYTPIISDRSYFKDTFIIELQRGCMNRCAFCTASYLNLPFRNYSYEEIISTIELGLRYTNKIALLGAQISAHPDFLKIIEYLKNKIESGQNISIGISSLRADSITEDLVKTLVIGGQKTSTIAIEAASERLRKFINKNLSKTQILDAIKMCRESGLKGLKIYSMIGIPNETMADIEEFITLAKQIKQENKGFKVEFSFSSFVPKPQTPFQWERREDTKSLEIKQRYLEKELSKIGIASKFSAIKWDYWQTFLSRGNSNLSEFLIKVYHNGGRLGAYKSAIKSLNIIPDKEIQGYKTDEILPWDIVQNCIEKNHLVNERKRLYEKLD